MASEWLRTAVALAIACVISGCAGLQAQRTYHTALLPAARGREAARQANEQGLTFARKGDNERAEQAFREALRADISYAAAHNNLGNTLLATGRYHESALELSFAKKLAPLAAEPCLNLGRLLETVGWTELAVKEYEQALALDDGNVEAMGRLAWVYVQTGREQDELEPLLRRLAHGDSGEEWKTWAVAELGDRARPAPQ